MKRFNHYSVFIVILLFAHAILLYLRLSNNVLFYLFMLGAAAAVIVVYKKIIVHAEVSGKIWNRLLLLFQLTPFSIYIVEAPQWFYFVPPFLFFIMEGMRIAGTNKIRSLERRIEELHEEQERMNETFLTVRMERHDFLKHISAIHFMLEQNKSKEAKGYLDKLVDTYEETNLSIKGERGTVAGILHHMYKEAKAANIEMIYDFDVPLSSLPLSDDDAVAFIGNILSNSIDACKEWQEKKQEKATITVQFYKRSGLYLLTCSNESLPIPTDILDGLFERFGKTTKEGDHEGLGTKIIYDIVQKYNGFLDFTYKKETFTLKIKIPAVN
ncbi:hypothetical protein GCM10010978_26590 [Compostibacillus humi]|uniref:Histidine kinase/HSP90-like ATPase domain-containing protein n=1 Tax=Compostibacillus humi TaxID=1245525 RepID=A0A8J2XFV7_9BACI|nr:GHKL domain-containing protein [Compostibacillus humi]GFZ85113.1 hypothetical protein GCM10010978_26590 [Compostibacillus humi]